MDRIDLQDGEVSYFPKFLEKKTADNYFKILLSNLDWNTYPIKIFGKEFLQPRLVALYGDRDLEYAYSGTKLKTSPWTTHLTEIKSKVETKTAVKFNSVLANLYRDGNDSNGWHADDEPSLGKNPIIASVSLGGERIFKLKHNNTDERLDILLEHGSLLIMSGATQHVYKHQIPKTKKSVSKRINLTFRTLLT